MNKAKKWDINTNSAARKPIIPQCLILMIVAVFCCIGLGGCPSFVSRFPVDELPDRSVPIVSGRMDSGAVRNTLGNPRIASRYWGVELFRDASSRTEIQTAFFIPIWISSDDIHRYTLVSFDKDKIAESTATGIHVRSLSWRPPIRHEAALDSWLHAGDFTFVNQSDDRHETLLVTPARRDVYLERSRFSSQCTAVIGCGTEECSDTLSVDEGPSLPLPATLRYSTVAALGLAPGNHTLKASGGRWRRSNVRGWITGEQSIAFSCREGEILYVVINVFQKEKSFSGARGEWRIDLHKDMPELFVDRHLVLYRGDQWLVNPEPEN